MKKIFLLLLVIGFTNARSQTLRVYFKDKAYVKADISISDVAISPKAIQNRILRGIELNQEDLPVNPNYVQALKNIGAQLKAKSRWFNYVLIEGVNETQLQEFDFIFKIERPEQYLVEFAEIKDLNNKTSASNLNYGLARQQIEMVRGEVLHDFNLQGQGITIAVLDGGFIGTDTGTAFDSLRINNQILGTKSFVNSSPTVYEDGAHGTRVLSILGGYLEGQIIGSAPKANYWLLKSERESSEKPVEMDNWLMAAEFADSVGADIISSSLGYNQFQGGIGDYVYADMDGNTTIVTKAADKAASKGILVVVSAGNEGNGAWRHITAPADGDSVLAIGSVTNLQNISSFSSRGPTSDGRIKPNVVAMGQAAANSSGNNASVGNGTSFSCPLVAGMAACLWQSNVSRTNMEIFKAIENSATIAGFPNNNYGHGIPNFELAFYNTIGQEESLDSWKIEVYPNPVVDELFLETNLKETQIKISIIDIRGRVVFENELEIKDTKTRIDFPFSNGLYVLKVEENGKVFSLKISK